VKATILLPTTGDRGPILDYSVGSVLGQTETDWELFIVGDGVASETRERAVALADADERITFFDFEKDVSRGELNRHELLTTRARGEIVAYLCDRDLYLPNHLSTLTGRLQSCDFTHSLVVSAQSDFSLRMRFSPLTCDSAAGAPAELNRVRSIPLSFVAHRLDAYRRLPHGWRATPEGWFTDQYMWDQFLREPGIRATACEVPTVVYLKRGGHPGWPTDRRVEESRTFAERYSRPDGAERFQLDLNLSNALRVSRMEYANEERKRMPGWKRCLTRRYRLE